MRRVFMACTAFFVVCSSAHADVLRVPEDYPTLAAAASAAVAGDEIVLGSGTWEGQVSFDTIGITIRGAGADITRIVPVSDVPRNDYLLSWDSRESVETPQSVASLSGVTLDGSREGDPKSQGSYVGLVSVSGTDTESFSMESCVLTGCYRPNDGVSAFFHVDQLGISDCLFDEVSGEAGSLVAWYNGRVSVDGCRFIRNGGYGAPLSAVACQELCVSNTLFSGISSMSTNPNTPRAALNANNVQSIRIVSTSFGHGGPDAARGDGYTSHLRLSGDIIEIESCAFVDEQMFRPSAPSNAVFTRCVGLAVPVGNGNIIADPDFVNPGSPGPDGVWRSDDDDPGDFTPAPGSPMIDAADGSGYSAFALDALGHPRLVDLAGAPNTGAGGFGFLDVGAVERQGGSLPCPADVNGDGLLSATDFNSWIIAFNAKTPACDQNGDGRCTLTDFNAWIINFNAGCG